jgi:hypothetical protein
MDIEKGRERERERERKERKEGEDIGQEGKGRKVGKKRAREAL